MKVASHDLQMAYYNLKKQSQPQFVFNQMTSNLTPYLHPSALSFIL
jgi:hypothetical protein